MGAKVRIGIIGSGGYGRTARKYLNNTGKFEIALCMDVSKMAAEKAAAEENSESATDIEAVLSRSDIEAVSINTPVLLHAEHSIKSMKAGKHVFITKPVTNNSKEAEKILDYARKNKLVFMVGHHARHMHEAEFVGKILKGSRLGKLCNGVLSCSSSGGLEQKEGDWRTIGGQNPGGPLLQCGIHIIDLLLSYFGPVKKVSSMMRYDITRFDVADTTMTLIEFKNGFQVTLISNYTTAYMHTYDFFGTKGNLHVHEHITGLGQHQIFFQPRMRGEHEAWQALSIPCSKSYPDSHGGVLERSFAKQIRTAKPDYSNAGDSIMNVRTLKIVEAAVESARTGKSVSIY